MENKTEIPGFYKSSEGVIINKDNEALKAYKKRKMRDQLISKLQVEMNDLKTDIAEIKQLLKGLNR